MPENMTFKVVNSYLIIRRILPEKLIDGFKLPEESEDGGILWHATVVAGDEEYPADTHILFSRYLPQNFTDGQEELLVLQKTDVVAIVS